MPLISFIQKTDRHGQLMLAYARGDADAFTALYMHYKDQLFRFFLRQCGNSAIAEELFQDVWMKVINSRENYQHTAKFSTWLYRIAHNRMIDHFRRHEPETEEMDEESLMTDTPDNPEALLSSQEKVDRFLTLLDTLPQAQREVFLLKEEAGLSLEEIAQATGSSFETAKSRLRYAVRKLRQSLDEAAA